MAVKESNDIIAEHIRNINMLSQEDQRYLYGECDVLTRFNFLRLEDEI